MRRSSQRVLRRAPRVVKSANARRISPDLRMGLTAVRSGWQRASRRPAVPAPGVRVVLRRQRQRAGVRALRERPARPRPRLPALRAARLRCVCGTCLRAPAAVDARLRGLALRLPGRPAAAGPQIWRSARARGAARRRPRGRAVGGSARRCPTRSCRCRSRPRGSARAASTRRGSSRRALAAAAHPRRAALSRVRDSRSAGGAAARATRGATCGTRSPRPPRSPVRASPSSTT